MRFSRFLIGGILWGMMGLPSAYLLWQAHETGSIWAGGKFTGFRYVDFQTNPREFNWAVRTHAVVVVLCYGGLISAFLKRLLK